MKILMIAPEMFFTVLGTPIAVKYLLTAMSELGHEVDVLTYPEGEDVKIKNVKLIRIKKVSIVKKIPVGFSWQKVVLDIFIFFKCFGLLRKQKYDVIHALEESNFIAYVMKLIFRITYVYDMDCSMVQNMLQNKPKLKFMHGFLSFFEGFVIKRSLAVIPVCDALGNIVRGFDESKKIQILEDVAEYDENAPLNEIPENLNYRNAECKIMYIGNLEKHQGIDLFLESYKLIKDKVKKNVALVFVGGKEHHLAAYQEIVKQMGLEKDTYFLGARPQHEMSGFLKEADILVSPRLRGENTPMKVYSYLLSGKAIVATRLATHTQVMNDDVSVLTEVNANAFSEGLLKLIKDPDLRKRIGENAHKLAKERYVFDAFKNKVDSIYKWIEQTIKK